MRKYLLPFLFLNLIYTAGAQTLSQDTLKIKDVVVTGQYAPQSLKQSVYQVRVISNEKIRLRAPVNIQQVLSTELGFRFNNDLTLGTADVQLMGMSGRNVKILLDGVPMADRSDTRESLNQVDINSVDRIEIVEGPMSVQYGTDALAGVINIITKKAVNGSVSMEASLQEESAGNEYAAINGKGVHRQHLGGAFKKESFTLLTGLTHYNFGGWNIGPPTATVLAPNQWLPKEQWMGNAKIGFGNSELDIWYRIDGVKESLDSRGPMNANNYKAKFAEYNTNRLTQQLQGNWKISNRVQLTGVLGYTSLKRATSTVIYDFVNGTESQADGPGEQDVAKFGSALLRSTLQYKLNEQLILQPGIEILSDHASGARIKGAPSINDFAFFVSGSYNINRALSVKPGLRFIKNSVYQAPPVIPSVNAKIRVSEAVDLRLGYANGFRSPALRELYFDFFDASHSIMGNANLKAERSNSFTGSVAWTARAGSGLKWNSTLSGFYNHFLNRIDYGQLAADPRITTLINVGKFKTTGATLENTLVWKNLDLSVGLAWIGTFNSYADAAASQARLPEFLWSPEVNTNLLYSFPSMGANLSLYYKFTGKRAVYTFANGTDQEPRLVTTGAFHLADLMFTKKFLNHLQINAGVKNLFNVTGLSNTATAQGNVHGTGGNVPVSYGRSYVLGLSFNFTKQ